MVKPLLLQFLPLFCTISAFNYILKIERVSTDYFNTNYYGMFSLRSEFVNRTTKGIMANVMMIKHYDKKDGMITVKAAKFMSNEYKQGAIQYSGRLYDFMHMPQFWERANRYCKPAVSWPLQLKVNYTCKGAVPNMSYYKNINMPTGRWRISINSTDRGVKTVDVAVFLSLEDVPTW